MPRSASQFQAIFGTSQTCTLIHFTRPRVIHCEVSIILLWFSVVYERRTVRSSGPRTMVHHHKPSRRPIKSLSITLYLIVSVFACRPSTGCWHTDHPQSNQQARPGRFGDYNCDSPWALIESAMHTMKTRQGDNIEFVLWTGWVNFCRPWAGGESLGGWL